MENKQIEIMGKKEQSTDNLKNLINKYKEQNTITIKSDKKIMVI